MNKSSPPERRPGPPGGKRDVNRKRRTEELLHAGLALFLDEGIESVTIDEIVERAALAKGSFYRYFADKGALVDALFAPIAAELEDAFDTCAHALERATAREQLTQAYVGIAERIGQAALAAPGIVRLYLQECRGPARGARTAVRKLARRLDARAIKLSRLAHHRGLLRAFDGEVSALAVVGAAEKLAFAVLSGRRMKSLHELSAAVVALVLDGLRANRA